MFDMIRSHSKIVSFKAYLGDENSTTHRSAKRNVAREENLNAAPRSVRGH